MRLTRAHSFAKALEANPRHAVREIEVSPLGKDTAYVEYAPSRPEAVLKFFREQQGGREDRAQGIRTAYRWRRIGRDTWRCEKPDGTIYTQYLYEPRCTCPDWNRINSVGGKCKHFICAEDAESLYRRDHAECGKVAA
jgi:hypothetical protein